MIIYVCIYMDKHTVIPYSKHLRLMRTDDGFLFFHI